MLVPGLVLAIELRVGFRLVRIMVRVGVGDWFGLHVCSSSTLAAIFLAVAIRLASG